MVTIQNQVRQYIRDNFQLGTTSVELGDDDSFMDAHLLDSTGFLELCHFLEDRFGIDVRDDEMLPENLDTLNAIAGYVGRKTGAGA
jgi:acyl carrier protein